MRTNSIRNKAAAFHYASRDHVHVSKLEDRLKQWHFQTDNHSTTPSRSLTRYVRSIGFDTFDEFYQEISFRI